MSQAAFAAIVGINQPRVSQLVAAGILKKGAPMRVWLLAYCANIREQAAGRSTEGDLDLSQERAALAREQRVSYEIKNAVARGDYAPVGLLADVLASASQAIIDRFDALPGRLKKARPSLTPEDHEAIQGAIGAACREWARSTGEMVDKRLILKYTESAEA